MPFRDVIGHRRLNRLLARSVEQETLPPSLILAGPSGIGKRLVASAIAQALNCTDPKRGAEIPFDACGVCASCKRIARGVHADIIIIEPGDSGSIKVDQVRDMIEKSGYRPFEGRRRVVMIDEADALVPAAQNALLKTLEEPPSSSVFMLITSRPDVLLDTVRSRCPRLRFRPLSFDEVAAALVKQGRSQADAQAVAVAADGSVGRALDISAGDVVEARDVAIRVLSQTAAGDNRRRADGAKELLTKSGGGSQSDREQLAAHLSAMASILRDIEMIATGADGELANADVRPTLEKLSIYGGSRGVDAFATVDRALAALGSNTGVKIVADWVALNV